VETEAEEEEEKIRLKQYVSLRSKGRHNYYQRHSGFALELALSQ
jgi:hypothetical protein